MKRRLHGDDPDLGGDSILGLDRQKSCDLRVDHSHEGRKPSERFDEGRVRLRQAKPLGQREEDAFAGRNIFWL